MSAQILSGISVGYGAFRNGSKSLVAALAVCVCTTTSALAAEVTIAALGDSLTQGYGLPQGEGFVPQLQDWLTARGEDVEVLNAGVSGDTTAGGLSRVDWTLTDDVDAMIVALGGNDLLRGIDPAVSRANLEGILVAAEERGVEVLLVGMTATSNYGTAYKEAFESMYPELAEAHDTLYYHSFFDALTEDGIIEENIRTYMQPDGIHPNAEGVAKIVADLGPYVVELANKAR
ncbi:arylesterase [Donghicola sp.]|jgi:acyl-CoA thioesterase-1|uniref:arylesterase n=1 Tax=Donghicola sp. TaxID=1929294 RepID=UPI0025EF3311|nr:arylesterase [Donghicola sp.]MCT4579148.1 arylesterase [Donghicola sp.]